MQACAGQCLHTRSQGHFPSCQDRWVASHGGHHTVAELGGCSPACAACCGAFGCGSRLRGASGRTTSLRGVHCHSARSRERAGAGTGSRGCQVRGGDRQHGGRRTSSIRLGVFNAHMGRVKPHVNHRPGHQAWEFAGPQPCRSKQQLSSTSSNASSSCSRSAFSHCTKHSQQAQCSANSLASSKISSNNKTDPARDKQRRTWQLSRQRVGRW
mmetsp:Transcript_8941/g.15512  ORF Transcript_8941/g.15512 Transcript_8941/m.15512 type:complete len:212 (+) Transcript_8941:1465-2100(+)